MRTLALSSACLALLLGISACSTPAVSNNAPNSSPNIPKIDHGATATPVVPIVENALTGIIWKVDRVDSTPVSAADNRSAPFIQLNKQDNSLSGFSGCNRIFGKFVESAGNQVQLQVASTKMACIDAEKQLLENKIQQALNDTVSYQFKDKQLYFYDAKQQQRLVFNNAGHAAIDDVPPANAQTANKPTTPQS